MLSIMRTIREGQSFLGKKEFLAGESCEGAGEFFDLQCQINTMLNVGYLTLKDTGTMYERNINQINNIEKQNLQNHGHKWVFSKYGGVEFISTKQRQI